MENFQPGIYKISRRHARGIAHEHAEEVILEQVFVFVANVAEMKHYFYEPREAKFVRPFGLQNVEIIFDKKTEGEPLLFSYPDGDFWRKTINNKLQRLGKRKFVDLEIGQNGRTGFFVTKGEGSEKMVFTSTEFKREKGYRVVINFKKEKKDVK